jgi:hypothetical protein
MTYTDLMRRETLSNKGRKDKRKNRKYNIIPWCKSLFFVVVLCFLLIFVTEK